MSPCCHTAIEIKKIKSSSVEDPLNGINLIDTGIF